MPYTPPYIPPSDNVAGVSTGLTTDLDAAYDAMREMSAGIESIPADAVDTGTDLGAALAGAFGRIPAVGSGVIYVSTAGDDGNDGLTPGAPKVTVQAGVDALPVEGGTVIIAAGEYAGSVTLRTGVRLSGAGRRATILTISDLADHGIEIIGTSPSPIIGVEVEGLWVQGPGPTSGGTGHGVHIEWAAGLITLRDMSVTDFGSHGLYSVNSYSMSFDRLIVATNGGDGFHTITNANQIQWSSCLSHLNAGRGYFVETGATPTFVNSGAEDNEGAGFDLRYCTAPALIACHMEGNGQDGTSPNVYVGLRNPGEPTNSLNMIGCLVQGASVAVRGLVLDGSVRATVLGNWFYNHVTDHIQTTSSTSRTYLGPNTYLGTGTALTDGSATTGIMDYDYTACSPRANFLLFTPRTGEPPIVTPGHVWYSSTLDQLRTRDATPRSRTVFSGLTGSAVLDFPEIPAQAASELTITVTGAVIGDVVQVGPPGDLAGGMVAQGRVSATNTVTVRLANFTAAPINPAAATWRVAVVR